MRKYTGFAAGVAGWTLTGVLLHAASSMNTGQNPPPAQPPPAPPAPAVKVGEAAPEFALTYLQTGADGKFERKEVRLSDFKGTQNVVLAFFPAAFSPG